MEGEVIKPSAMLEAPNKDIKRCGDGLRGRSNKLSVVSYCFNYSSLAARTFHGYPVV